LKLPLEFTAPSSCGHGIFDPEAPRLGISDPEALRLGIFDFSVSLPWQFLIDDNTQLKL
jgi:hypothetical protein